MDKGVCWKVWSPDLGQDISESEEVFADSQEEAVQDWARGVDWEDNIFAGLNTSLQVCVQLGEGQTKTEFIVQRKMVLRYIATNKD